MRPPDILEYAAAVVGFPIHEGQTIYLNEPLSGTVKNFGDFTAEAGSEAQVLSIQMLPFPSQLTVLIQVPVPNSDGNHLFEMYAEDDEGTQFPFDRAMTPEERAADDKAKEIEASKATTATAGSSVGSTSPSATNAQRAQQHQSHHGYEERYGHGHYPYLGEDY